MRRIAFAVGLVVLGLGVAILAQTQTGSVEQELIKLENKVNDGFIKRDWAFLSQIFANDYIGTDSDGNLWTKAQEIANLKSGEEVITSAVADDFRVRVYGDAAVVNYRYIDKSQSKGKDTSGQHRTTDTWVRLAGRWQLVAEHVTKIAQK
jgi:ketosteroid isomerase-like protein